MTVYGPAPGSGPGLLFEMDATDERAEETDTAERCDDPTPRGVIRAALTEVMKVRMVDGAAVSDSDHSPFAYFEKGPEWIGSYSDCGGCGLVVRDAERTRPIRVLDVGAGYGAWSSEMRRLAQAQGWPVHITGVELLAAREKHGRKWCDKWLVGDWRLPLYTDEEPPQYDLAIGNPPFDELTGPKGAKRKPWDCMPAVLLKFAPAVLLLHTQQAFLKSEAGRASWRWSPPAASWLVPGGVSFRGPGKGSDSTCYQVTLWLRDHTGPCSVYMLDDLPPSSRSWTVPPGTEEPSRCESCGGTGKPPKPEEWAGEVCGDCHGPGLDPNGDLPSAPGYQP